MSTRGGWYAAQSKTNPDLFRVIFDFNQRPQNWVHAGVLEGLPHAPVVMALTGAAHGTAHLSAWLIKELGLGQDEPCWDFEEPRRRLHLLSAVTLARLARFCGAAMTWPRLVSVIGRVELHEIKGALGEDAHAFALRRGRLMVHESEALIPEAQEPVAPAALEVGWRLVLTAAADESEALGRRFALKLPPGLPKLNLGKVVPEVRERAWERVRKISPEVLTEGELKCFA